MAPEDAEDALRLAGWIAMRLPRPKLPGLRLMDYGAVGDPQTAYGYTPLGRTVVRPTAAEIDFADEVLQWPSLLPTEDVVRRRIVSLRMQWDGDRHRHLFPFRQIGELLRCSPVAARTWHLAALRIIAAEVGRSPRRLDTLRRLGFAPGQRRVSRSG